MSRALRGLCWTMLASGIILMALTFALERNVTHALWALPVQLTLIICGFNGLLVLHVLPDAMRIFALAYREGQRDQREGRDRPLTKPDGQRPRLTLMR